MNKNTKRTNVVERDTSRRRPDKTIQARSARWRFRRIWEVFAGNTRSRSRSNRLIPAYSTDHSHSGFVPEILLTAAVVCLRPKRDEQVLVVNDK